MRICFCFFILLGSLLVKFSYSQRPDVNWTLGNSGGQPYNLHFTSGGIQVDSVIRNANFNWSNTSYSDSTGNLVLWTNGCRVSNTITDTIQDGYLVDTFTGCANYVCPYLGGALANGALIFKCEAIYGRYIVFNEYCSDLPLQGANALYYSIVDMNANAGQGAVLQKNQLVLTDTLSSSLAATRHSNGRYWWLLEQKLYTNQFIKILINDSGQFTRSYQNVGPVFGNPTAGQTRFSPDGTRYFTSTDDGNVRIFGFDRCNGQLSYQQSIILYNDSIYQNGFEISPSGRYLYIASLHHIFQFDLSAANIQQTMQDVALYDGYIIANAPAHFWWMNRGPDGKIYVAAGYGARTLHVINDPDSPGVACNVIQHILTLPTGIRLMPSFPNYTSPPMDINCDSILQVQIHEVNNIAGLEIYPNPVTNSKFYIDYEENEKSGEITITNLTGAILQQQRLQHEVECELPSGIYILRIKMDNGKFANRKMVVVAN